MIDDVTFLCFQFTMWLPYSKEIVAGQQEGVVLEGPRHVILAHVACSFASYTHSNVASFAEGMRLLMYHQGTYMLS